MRLFLTGHRGYIGSHAVELFRAAGWHVTGLDAGLYTGTEAEPLVPPDEEIPLDLAAVEPGMLQGADVVLHLAAISNDPMGALDPGLTRRVNLDGTLQLAEAARSAGVGRFLFASSCSIYGASGDEPVTEEAPLAPLSEYAETKIEAERALRGMESDEFLFGALRCATAHGASPALRTDLAVNNLLAWALAEGSVKLLSDGSSWRPFAHCRDIARGFLALANAPASTVRGLSVNFGADEENFRIREVADLVHDAVPEAPVSTQPGASVDPRDYRVDFRRLREALPDFRIENGVRRSLQGLLRLYRSRPDFRAEFLDGRYARLEILRQRLEDGALQPLADHRPGGRDA